MSVIGVAPQQAVHVSVRRSYNQLSTTQIDPAHHAVASVDLNKFIGVLPDNAGIIKSNYPGKDDEEHAVSVQISGLCSACLYTDEKKDSLVAGMPIIWNMTDKRLEVVAASKFTESVAKFIDYIEDYPGHNDDKHIHAIISLTGLDQPAENPLSDDFTRFSTLEITANIGKEKVEAILNLQQSVVDNLGSKVAKDITEVNNSAISNDEKRDELTKNYQTLKADQKANDAKLKRASRIARQIRDVNLIADIDDKKKDFNNEYKTQLEIINNAKNAIPTP